MASDDFHKQLLDNQRTALLLLDQHLCIRYLNAAAEDLLQVGRQKLMGTPLAAYFIDAENCAQVFASCRSDGHPITCREMELRDTNGHILQVDYSVSHLHDNSGRPALLVEIQPVNQLLRLSREEGWQQAHLATRQLVRGVAHELKNPLGGIRGAAQLLASALPDPQWQEYLDVIIAESDRLSGLANRLLGAKRSLELQDTNIHQCLERVRQLLQAEHPTLAIERDYDPSLPDLQADQDQLLQALLNLTNNAVESMLENHINEPRLRLRTRAMRQFTINGQRHRLALRVDIIDNGPGVPEELREALFFPMVTGRAQGTGLGLAFVQDIASQHQGVVEYDSQPGHTCFSLILPFEPDAQQAAHNATATGGQQ